MSKNRQIGKKLLKGIVYSVLFLVFLPILLVLILQIPPVQNALKNKVTAALSEKLGTEVRVNKLRIGIWKDIYAQGVFIRDLQKDTLLFAGELGVNISFLRLLKKEICFSHVQLRNARVNVYRNSGAKDFNYSFIARAFATDTTRPSSWKVDLHSVLLEKVRVRYDDVPGGSLIHSEIGLLDVDIGDLGLESGHVVLDQARVERSLFALTLQKPEETRPPQTRKEAGPDIRLEELSILASRFKYNNFNYPPSDKGMDYNRLDIGEIEGTAEDILVNQKDIHAAVNRLALKEKSGFVLTDLKGALDLTEKDLALQVEKLVTPQSVFNDKVVVNIPVGKHVNIGEMKIHAALLNDTLSMRDLNFFVPGIDTMEMLHGKALALSGKVTGKLNDLSWQQLALRLDHETSVKGSMTVKGLPAFKTAYVDLHLQPMTVNMKRISQWVKNNVVQTAALGNVKLEGSIKGKITNPRINISANTQAGNVVFNGTLKTDTSFSHLAYDADVSAAGLALEKVLIPRTGVGKVSLKASFKGSGADIEHFQGEVSSVEYQKHLYKGITFSGSLEEQVLDLIVYSVDPTFSADLDLMADLKEHQYTGEGIVRKADLDKMGYSGTPVSLSGRVKFNLTGTEPDNISGTVKVYDPGFDLAGQRFQTDSLILASSVDGAFHNYTVTSPAVSSSLSGNFKVNELPAFFKSLSSTVTSPAALTSAFRETETINFRVLAGDISALVHTLLPDVTFVDSLNAHASFIKDNNRLSFSASLGALTVAGKEMKDISLEGSGSGDSLTYTAGVASAGITRNVQLKEVSVDGILLPGETMFNLKVFDHAAPTRADMHGVLTFQGDSMSLTIPWATIYVEGKKWEMDRHNNVVYAPGFLSVEDIAFVQGDQKILVNSRISRNASEVRGHIENLRLSQLSALPGLSEYKLQGRLSGKFNVTDPLGGQGIESDFTVDSFGLNNMLLGKLTASAHKQRGSDLLGLQATIEDQVNQAALQGTVSLTGENILDIDLHIPQMALQPWQPFVKTLLYKMEGMVSGDFKISGPAASPGFTGTLLFPGDNRIGFNLFHTEYRIRDQKIVFGNDIIRLDHFVLHDSLDNAAVARGSIYHHGFKDMRFDLSVSSDNFQVINSGPVPDVLMYGEMFARMNVRLSGPLEKLVIDLDVVTRKGSKVFIPLATARPSEALPDYIHFAAIEVPGSKDTVADGRTPSFHALPARKINYSRFDVRGQVRVTEDAELNIVVDPLNGDMITAKGNGTFAMDFDSENNMNLYGVYTISEGSYEFSFVNLVKKNFTIQKGSTISWSGDFEHGTMDVVGLYKTRASRYNLIADQSDFMTKEEIDAAKRPLPVEVYLNLAGELLSPDISFSIKAPEGGDPLTGNLVVQKVNQINNDPNELSKQAFSLIMLNRFADPNAGLAGGTPGGNVALNEVNQSVSRVLNTQLNQLSGDYLQGVDINVNLQSLDQSYGPFAQNAHVMVTKKISSRISVSAGGNVNINSSYGSGQFAGDYNVYYRINPNGSVSLKFFRTSMQTIYTNNLYTQSGFSLNYRREFSRWSRLFHRRRGERQARKNKEGNTMSN